MESVQSSIMYTKTSSNGCIVIGCSVITTFFQYVIILTQCSASKMVLDTSLLSMALFTILLNLLYVEIWAILNDSDS